MAGNDYALRAALRRWRDEEAARQNRKPFHIFHNSALDDMVKMRPQSKAALVDCKGIAGTKANQFGDQLVAIIRAHTHSMSSGVGTPSNMYADHSPPMTGANANRLWTDEDMNRLAQYSADGKSVGFMAAMLGRSELAVRMRLGEVGGAPVARRLDYSAAA